MLTQKLPEDHTEAVDAIEIPSGVTPELHLAIKQADASYEVLMNDRKSLLARVGRFEAVESPDDTVTMADAKILRLLLVKNRTALDRTRKAVGDKWRLQWQAINETFKPLLAENESAEEFLKESEDFLVNYDASRKAEIRDARANELRPYADPAMYQLGDATEGQWQGILAGAKFAHDQRVKAEEAQRQAVEDARLAGERERMRLAEENKALLAQQAADRAAGEAQRQKDAAVLAAAQDKAHKDKAVADAALAAEREKNRKIEEAAALKLAAEKKAADEAKKVAAKAARAPDKEKLLAFTETLMAVGAPPMKSGEAEQLLRKFAADIKQLVYAFRDKVETL